MPTSLKSTAQLLARKYSWHTLGDNLTICTHNVNFLEERNVSKPIRKNRPLNAGSEIVNPTGVRRKRILGLPSSPRITTSVAKSHAVHEKLVIFKPSTKSKRLIEERMVLTQEIYKDYNEMAFEGLLPPDLSISWSGRLTSTAGITKMSTQTKGAKKLAEIVLSEKVLDDSSRLRATLLHEMCHAASWLIDGERKPPHGPGFWKWASICSANIPGMLVSTCHSYKIHKPYQYQCIDCKQVYGRHSKRSNIVENQCCGICKGRLEFSGKYNSDGTPKKPRNVIVLD